MVSISSRGTFGRCLVWRQTEPALFNQRLQIELTQSERVSGRVSDKIAPSQYVIHCTCVQYG